jgi:hypothetical protein
VRRDGRASTEQGYDESATYRTPDREGSLLVTLALVVVLPTALIALVYPAAVVSVEFGAVLGLAAGGV